MSASSLIFITIDCLRADHTGFMGYQRSITPNMDMLAKESLVFENAVVAGSPTYNSFPALMAGRYPLSLGRDIVGIAPDETTLASFLKSKGYSTGAIIAGNPYISRWMGYEQGFEEFIDFLEDEHQDVFDQKQKVTEQKLSLKGSLNKMIQRMTGPLPLINDLYKELYFWYGIRSVRRRLNGDYSGQLLKYTRADVITNKAIDWINKHNSKKEPFFLWLHYMDTHRPYFPPKEALEKIERSDISEEQMFVLRNLWLRNDISADRLMKYRKDFIDLYDASVVWVDSQVGRLAEFLTTSGLIANTAITVTSDHGEAFLEHGERDHYPVLLTNEMIKVPLLVRVPGTAMAKRKSFPLSHIDLAPTLLEMMGVTPPVTFTGKGRWSAISENSPWSDPVITEVIYGYEIHPLKKFISPGMRLMAVQNEQHKLVVNFSKEQIALFDLKTDPEEKQSILLSANPKVSAELIKALISHTENERNRRYSRPELTRRIHRIKDLLNEKKLLQEKSIA